MTTRVKKWVVAIPPHDDVIVEADNWMTALYTVRKSRGDQGGLPPGVNCSIAADGVVTVTNATAGSTYKLTPEDSASFPEVIEHLGQLAPSNSAPPPIDLENDDSFETPSVPAIHSRSISQPPAQKKVASTSIPSASAIELLHEQRHEPSATNPLSYIERAYVAAGITNPSAMENLLQPLLDAAKVSLENASPGRFIRIAGFDHSWKQTPLRKPVAVLEWKDWQQPAVVQASQAQSAPRSEPPTELAPQDPQERLSVAFEALQELHSATFTQDALKITTRALRKSVPSEHAAAALYNIDKQKLEWIAAEGFGAQQRENSTHGSDTGLCSLVLSGADRIVVIDDATQHPKFDATIDAPLGLTTRSMLLVPIVRDRQIFALLQLVNRTPGNTFSAADQNVALYVAKQLGEHLHLLRTSLPPM